MKTIEYKNTKYILSIPIALSLAVIFQWFGFTLNIDEQFVFQLFFLFFSVAVIFDNRLFLFRRVREILDDPKQVILAIPLLVRVIRNKHAFFKLFTRLPYGRQLANVVAFIWVSLMMFFLLFIRVLTNWLVVVGATSMVVWIHIQYVISTVEFVVLGVLFIWFMAIRSYRLLSNIAICVVLVLLAAVVYTRMIMNEVLTDKLFLWAYIFLCIGVGQKWFVSIKQDGD